MHSNRLQLAIHNAYSTSAKRLLLLDYDGTLVDLAPTPPEAKPTTQLLAVLSALAQDPRNTVVIISGRDMATLDAWLGPLSVALVAEHGSFVKHSPAEPWQTSAPERMGWKQPVRSLFPSNIQGTFVEEKTASLAWHYRQAWPHTVALIEASRLGRALQPLADLYHLEILHGHKVVEVRPKGASKGTAAKRWLDAEPWDFILAAGDDVTDESLFDAMPEQAFTIKVGRGTTKARLRLPAPGAFVELLASLCQA